MKTTTVLAIILLLSTSAFASEGFPEEWLTVAEKTDFRATSSYDQTMVYLYRLEAAAPETIGAAPEVPPKAPVPSPEPAIADTEAPAAMIRGSL